MIAKGFVVETTKPQKRADIAMWCSAAYKDLPESMVRNAWRHGLHTFFAPTAAQAPEVATNTNVATLPV